MNELLAVRPSSLGDVVHALALVADVRAAHPALAIDWVAEQAFVELPALCPDVRRTVPIALRRWRHALFARDTWREVHAFRMALRHSRYDVILDLQEQVKGGIVSRTARGVRHGFDRSSIREPIATVFDDVHHRISRTLHFSTRCRMLAAAALGYTIEGPPRWRFAVPEQVDTMPVQRYVVALHATSRADKLWPEADWQALLARFSGAGLAIVLPWGSADERIRSERLAAGVRGAVVPPRQPLTSLATLLAHAEIVVGVDTGLTHFAAALGAPTLALFTRTDPARAGVAITGSHARDLGGNGCVPSAGDVLAAAGEMMRNAPRC